MVWLILIFSVILTITGVTSEGCTGFTYEGAEDGQQNWGKYFNQCSGKHQSPIDIDSCFVQMVVLSPLQMEGFDYTAKASLTNNGHTAMMKIDSVPKPTLSGGPLDKEYEFGQLHFHWGANDTVGSENKIDGKSYTLELHMVFYKKEYGSVDASLNHSDGLCVLACIFEISDKINEKYNSFVQLLPKVIKPGQVAVFPKAPALFDLLPQDLSQYFTYPGSLTTPPCNEVVTWIDFRQTIKIKSTQLAAFRNLVDSHGHQLINNFRAIQPLGDRKVRRNIGNTKDCNLKNNRKEEKDQRDVYAKIKQSMPPPPPKRN